jgi:hypothetical protein
MFKHILAVFKPRPSLDKLSYVVFKTREGTIRRGHVDLPVNFYKSEDVGIVNVTFLRGDNHQLQMFVVQHDDETGSAINYIEDIIISAIGAYTKGVTPEDLIVYIKTPYKAGLSKASAALGNILFSKPTDQEETKVLAAMSYCRADQETCKAS